MNLRPYQRQAIDATTHYLRMRDDNPCIVLPTGAGKSVVMAAMIQEYLAAWPSTRICILAHVKELVAQNAAKLAAVWPAAPLGIYSAGLGKRQSWAPVLFASIQSVYRRAAELGRFDLVLVDEAHRIPIRGEGTYRRFLAEARERTPELRVIGFTATPYRLGHGMVVGPGAILNGISYEADVRALIEDGYLCRLVSKGGIAQASLDGVNVRQGEYVARELEAAVDRHDVVEAAMDEVLRLAADRHAWLVFCAGVSHAGHVSEALARRGVEAPVIHAETPAAERDDIIARYQRRELRAIVNVNVLSEGFDAPHVDCVVMLRPTKSAGLYYQQVGRGLRLHPDKADCLVLDFAGNIAEHGPVDSIRVRRARKAGESATMGAPTRQCPDCQQIVLISQPTCPGCGYAWPPPGPVHQDTASDAPILSNWTAPEWVPVKRATYARHVSRNSGKPTLQVTYHCGLSRFREWVCIEHDGYAGRKAARWWRERTDAPLHLTVDAALELVDQLRTPDQIQVDTNERYPRIVGHAFAEPEAEGEPASSAARDAGAAGGDTRAA